MPQVELCPAFTAATNVERGASDGTAADTALVKDIRPGVATSNPDAITPLAAGGAVFFASDGDRRLAYGCSSRTAGRAVRWSWQGRSPRCSAHDTD